MKHILQSVIEDAGYATRDYSGRGMNGKACLGVILHSNGTIRDFFADIIESISIGDMIDHLRNGGGKNKLGDLADAFRNFRQDDLGNDIIIYFPKIQLSDED